MGIEQKLGKVLTGDRLHAKTHTIAGSVDTVVATTMPRMDGTLVKVTLATPPIARSLAKTKTSKTNALSEATNVRAIHVVVATTVTQAQTEEMATSTSDKFRTKILL